MPGPAVEAAAKGGGHHHHDGGHHHDGHGCGGGKAAAGSKWEKTYLDVLGICCTAEVALVERLLSPIHGVRAVTVVVPSRTVIVDHDTAVVSQFHIGNQIEIPRSSPTYDRLLPTLSHHISRLPLRYANLNSCTMDWSRSISLAHFPDQ